jgi:hypothetical protein
MGARGARGRDRERQRLFVVAGRDAVRCELRDMAEIAGGCVHASFECQPVDFRSGETSECTTNTIRLYDQFHLIASVIFYWVERRLRYS